jgi:hypothetical protein
MTAALTHLGAMIVLAEQAVQGYRLERLLLGRQLAEKSPEATFVVLSAILARELESRGPFEDRMGTSST